jgi:hypothetical protein
MHGSISLNEPADLMHKHHLLPQSQLTIINAAVTGLPLSVIVVEHKYFVPSTGDQAYRDCNLTSHT